MRSRTSILQATVWLLLVASSSTAMAQGVPGSRDAQRADELFVEASALVKQNNFAAACPKLEESQRLDPGLGTQFNLGLCYVQIGKLAGAWRNFRAVERLAHATGKSAREVAAKEILAELRSKVPHLVLVPAEGDVTLRVDGADVDREEWSFYAVEPGEHIIDATAPAKQPWQRRVVVDAAQLALPVDIPPLNTVTPKLTSPSQAVTTVPAESSSNKRAIGFALGGVGVLGLAGAVTTGLLVLSAKSVVDEKCTPACVDQEGHDAVSRGKVLLPINMIAWGIAVVGLGVGSYLVLTSGSKQPARAGLGPYLGL
jgi:hypothetical protein